jgi:N-acetylglucosamine kinase-like BadF-type ATPase
LEGGGFVQGVDGGGSGTRCVIAEAKQIINEAGEEDPD